jgi:hypothetical protein
MSAGQFQTIRKIVFREQPLGSIGLTWKLKILSPGVSTLFSLIVLVLAADVLNTTTTIFLGAYFSFDALAVATAVLTVVSLPTMSVFLFGTRGRIFAKS